MSELGEWLGPAIAAVWILVRVVPRLLRKRASAGPEATAPPALPTPADSERQDGSDLAPPPIEPR